MIRVALIVLVTAIGVGVFSAPAFASSLGLALGLFVTALITAALGFWTLQREGNLKEMALPRWGDLSIGAVLALVLVFAALNARSVLAPAGTSAQSWLLHVYAQLGNPDTVQRSVPLTVLVLVTAALFEYGWRAGVQYELSGYLGPARAALATAALAGLAVAPSAVTLADAEAGLNPLLVLVAIVANLAFGFTAVYTKRLPPTLVASAIFAYFSLVELKLPGLLPAP
jgi:membrane protease YdiL (CAAX protease family)